MNWINTVLFLTMVTVSAKQSNILMYESDYMKVICSDDCKSKSLFPGSQMHLQCSIILDSITKKYNRYHISFKTIQGLMKMV